MPSEEFIRDGTRRGKRAEQGRTTCAATVARRLSGHDAVAMVGEKSRGLGVGS
jgi:hypothetical protein